MTVGRVVSLVSSLECRFIVKQFAGVYQGAAGMDGDFGSRRSVERLGLV